MTGTLRGVMSAFSKAAVEEIISGLNLEESNRVFAAHWLSLWEGDALPPGARFSPAKLKAFLPGLLKFDVVPDRRVTVRLAGTGYSNLLQKDPTGSDWIAAAPQDHRATRLRTFSAIARGAVLVAHRRVAMLHGDGMISEEILLPFAPETNGAVAVLGRVNFTPAQFMRVRSIAQVTGDPLDHTLVSFPQKTD
ncbi:MAG: PAS domain-containing protein [Proteobacteria bacterium]|nr:PAS domain-containing protein [Pseudomonadota bacterium]